MKARLLGRIRMVLWWYMINSQTRAFPNAGQSMRSMGIKGLDPTVSPSSGAHAILES